MHNDAKNFVRGLKKRFPEYFTCKKVVEVGSLDINGSCRDLFENCRYTGWDMHPGKGVDVVGRFTSRLLDTWADVVFSTEALEHDDEWAITLDDMCYRAQEFVFFTCATTGRKEHGTHNNAPESSPATNHHYLNITQDMVEEAIDLGMYFSEWGFETNEQSHDLYFWGCKK